MKSKKCWAAPVSQCSKKMTKEHVFTKSLFKDQVKITSDNIKRGDSTPSWLKSNSIEPSIRKLTANILCETHNKILGEGPDRTAKKLMNALLRLKQPMKLPGSKIMRPPVAAKISGTSFGQWLCKIQCNMLAANELVPDDDFVFYAFGKPTQKKLFFYFPARIGYGMQIERGHVTYIQYIDKNNPSENIFEITLAGLKVLVSTIPIEKIAVNKQLIAEMGWFDRIKCIQQLTPLGPYRITFDWSNEPSYQVVPD